MLFLVASAGLLHAEDLTLQDALDRALRANLELRQDQVELEQVRHYVAQLRAAWDPELVGGASTGGSTSLTNSVLENEGADLEAIRYGTQSWTLGVEQDLPTGGSTSLQWTETRSTSDSPGQVLSSYVRDGAWWSVSQPVLSGAGLLPGRSSLRQAGRDLDQQELSYRASVESLVVDVAGAYWTLVAARETVQLARRSLDISMDQLADTRERRAEGFAALGDVLQVERAVGVARQALVVAEAELQASEEDLRRLLGMPLASPGELIPVDRPRVPELVLEADHVLARAREANAAWRWQQLELQATEDAWRVTRNSALPSVDVSGGVGWSGLAAGSAAARGQVLSFSYPAWSLSVDVSVPVGGRAGRRQVERAWLEVQQVRLATEAAAQDLELDVRAAIRDLERDRARVELAHRTVEAAEAALAADQELLRDGRGSTRDVVRSLESLDAALAARLEAEIDFQQSLFEVYRVEGVLLDTLGIAPPAP